ncbi:MAG TPA: DUF6152 family protein [Pseudonocardia sp.]|jgi:hypothetical protein|uniref:DUF6152 family protein n=1 Tax=Pseudonocardia sp. TaxID=60912 RepID=UPI002B4B738E|nr:DUF6152 family protein [Pseudonocardia sp.]HLU56342.1 DUF6152 family protein [Pseudonocardia sp.]
MRRTLSTLVLPAALACALTLLLATPAAAHHGWDEYDTTAARYVSGTVVDVRWGNPHPDVTIEVDRPVAVPAGWADLDIPPELEEIGGREVLAATRPYEGGAAELHLDLAPVERLAAWGMEGEVRAGETIQAVGYLGRDDDTHLRPELIVLQDGQVVRQRSVPLPDAPRAAAAQDTATGPAATAPAADQGGGPPAAVWVVIGAAAVAGGVGYAVRRAGRG